MISDFDSMDNVHTAICKQNIVKNKLSSDNSRDSISSSSLSTLDQEEFIYVEHTHAVEVRTTKYHTNVALFIYDPYC